MQTDSWWHPLGNGYEYELACDDQRHIGPYATGWCRCVGGRLADGRWPEWNYNTGQQRYSN